MTDDVTYTQKVADILSRLRPDAKTPMMRFVYEGWSRSHYERLDRYLQEAEIATSRYILADDHGILVGSFGWPVAHLPIR